MAAAKSAIGAGKNDINDLVPVKPADTRVIEAGQFAVTEHGHGLLFVAVVGGFRWAIPGRDHYALIIETQDDNGATFLHKARVDVVEVVGQPLSLIWYKN